MSKPRPTADAWADARRRWEADPKENFETIGKSLGVSRVAASKRAAKEGWERVQSLRQIVEKAQLQADSKVTAKLSQVTEEERKEATVAQAINKRADVLVQHRGDWEEHRELFPLTEIKQDFEVGKQAKISAEMLMIRQKGERAAYGLDTEEDPGGVLGAASDEELDRRFNELLARRAT